MNYQLRFRHFVLAALGMTALDACQLDQTPGARIEGKRSSYTISSCGGSGGSPDDTATVQNAIDNYDEVLLPPTICYVSSLTLDANTYLHGQGPSSVLHRLSGGTNVITGSGTGVTIADLTIDGNQTTTSTPAYGGIYLTDASTLTVVRTTIREFAGAGIAVVPNFGTNQNIKIAHNTIHDVGVPLWLAGNGSLSSPSLSKVSVTNNTVSGWDIGWPAVYLRGIVDTNVSGNAIQGGSGASISMESGVFSTNIAHNVIRPISSGYGVQLGLGGLNVGSDIQVIGNMISGGSYGIGVLRMSNARYRGLVLSANTLVDNTSAGIYLEDAEDIVVSNNQIRNAAVGIDIETGIRGGLDRVIVSGNHVRGKTSGSPVGILLNSTNLTDIVLSANSLRPDPTHGTFTAVSVAQAPGGAFEAANNLGWKGGASGFHSGRNASGTCTITASSGDCSFGTNAEPDTNYRIALTPTAAPANPAKAHIVSMTKATSKVTVTTETALSGGDTVSFDWILMRDPQ